VSELTIREATSWDIHLIQALLREVELPVESVDSSITKFYTGMQEDVLAGVAGFEFYGDDVLLRSVAVKPGLQKNGLGHQLTDWMIQEAKKRDVRRIVLLTETAERFFTQKGFKAVDRKSIENDAMKQSSEFTFACPSSAVCMVLNLK
jgi:N-acetylglutamate synthase-like GNAT family acetyltransferase